LKCSFQLVINNDYVGSKGKINHSRNSLLININKVEILWVKWGASMDDIYPIFEVMEKKGRKALATIIRVNKFHTITNL